MEKCNKESWALGAWWYCVLPKGHEGVCESEMPEMTLEQFLETNGRMK